MPLVSKGGGSSRDNPPVAVRDEFPGVRSQNTFPINEIDQPSLADFPGKLEDRANPMGRGPSVPETKPTLSRPLFTNTNPFPRIAEPLARLLNIFVK
jgi:hypothetical protein